MFTFNEVVVSFPLIKHIAELHVGLIIDKISISFVPLNIFT